MKIGRIWGCHQRPDRSFYFRGYQFPVCMRCTGIFVGFVIAMFVYGRMSIRWWINCLLLIPLVFDGCGQYMGYWESTKYSRVLTGLLAGFGCMMMEFMFIEKIIHMMEELL